MNAAFVVAASTVASALLVLIAFRIRRARPAPSAREQRLIHGKTAFELMAERRQAEREWSRIRDYLIDDPDMKALVADLVDPPTQS